MSDEDDTAPAPAEPPPAAGAAPKPAGEADARLEEMRAADPDAGPEDTRDKSARDLEAVFDVPVKVSAVLGRARMEVSNLLKLGPGTVLELDRKVGEAIDIYDNDRLVARGEVVLVEDKLGVTMTEIIKAERN
jgi:flagellar motor switch protein FliN/FliY